MAYDQAEKGYTKIANELLEAITKADLSLRELKIIFVVMRYTYGFNRKEAELSVRFISEASGIKFQHISKSINDLIAKNIIISNISENHKQGRIITLIKDYEKWIFDSSQKGYGLSENRSQKRDGIVPKEVTVLSKTVPFTGTKKERYKENIKKEILFLETLPENLKDKRFIESWKYWITYRKEIKKPVTESAAKLQLKKLSSIKEKGFNPIEIINKSIESNWIGLFEPKNTITAIPETKINYDKMFISAGD
jgi:phage replication O-like protein O